MVSAEVKEKYIRAVLFNQILFDEALLSVCSLRHIARIFYEKKTLF